MIEINLNYNGVELKIKGEAAGVLSIIAELKQLVDGVQAAMTATPKKK